MGRNEVDDEIDALNNISPEAKIAIKRKKLELHYALLERGIEKAQKHGRLIQPDDINEAAYELDVSKPIITKDIIKEALEDGQDYLKNYFSLNSAWDCAMLISTLLEIGEDSNSLVIKRTRELLLSKKILTGDGLELWGHPDNNIPNIFDISFAVIALIKLGSSRDSEIIKNAIEFIKCSRDGYGGWQAIPGREGIDVGATSWAIIALLTCGLSESDDYITKGINWLKDNQRDDGGWGAHYKDSPIKKSYITRTYDAVMALLAAHEASESENIMKAKKWLIEQHKLLSGNSKTNTWVWGWDGYKTEDIVENDIENTVLAVLTLLKLNFNADSDLIMSGINTILVKRNEECLWVNNAPRAVLCLNEFNKSYLTIHA